MDSCYYLYHCTVKGINHRLDFSCRHVFSFPTKGITNSINKIKPTISIRNQNITGFITMITYTQNVGYDFLFSCITVYVSRKSSDGMFLDYVCNKFSRFSGFAPIKSNFSIVISVLLIEILQVNEREFKRAMIMLPDT